MPSVLVTMVYPTCIAQVCFEVTQEHSSQIVCTTKVLTMRVDYEQE